MSVYKQGKEIFSVMHQQKSIFNIYREGKRIFTMGGLSVATYNSILAAFGMEEGKMVWEATVKYASKNPDISPFINEDPLFVCSLGLNVPNMPVRKVTSNGNGYLQTSITEDNIYGLKFGMRVNGIKASYASYMGGTLDDFTIGATGSGKSYAYIRLRKNEITQILPTTTDKLTEYEFVDGKIKVDGIKMFTYSGTPFSTVSNTYITLGNNGNHNRPNYCSFSHVEIYDKINNEHKYLPFIREGIVGMINVRTNEMTTAEGVWTIEYELPNGGSWVPLTASIQ